MTLVLYSAGFLSFLNQRLDLQIKIVGSVSVQDE